jgi:phosphoribosylformylglycinamidine synthase
MNAVLDHAARGGAVLGVCNGFQVLTETGMVPGVLIRNAGLKFACRNVDLKFCDTMASPFTAGFTAGQKITIPIAHNEGNYFAADDELRQLEDNGQIALRYTAGAAYGPANPNGSARDIAGVLSANGRVMGMMPHPERAMSPLHGNSDGAQFLSKSLEALVS